MNAGLSNLTTLKAWLLTAAMRTGTDYDDQILAIGRGVAGLCESYCGRSFPRAVGATFEFPAHCPGHVIVPRYPLEEVTKVELRETLADGWIDQGTPSSSIVNIGTASGLVDFGGPLGGYQARGRITYTGGYFFEELDSSDVGYPTTQPVGSEALPEEVRLAWLLQCEHVWSQRDKLGLAISEKPSEIGALAKISLLDVVKLKLAAFVRFKIL